MGEDITEVGRETHFIRVEDWNDIYYWITCRMDHTGVKFSIRVGRDLVIDPNVKNGFSNPTKAQEGRDWPRKDVVNRRRKKALCEGCREKKEARAVVSSRGKMNNK